MHSADAHLSPDERRGAIAAILCLNIRAAVTVRVQRMGVRAWTACERRARALPLASDSASPIGLPPLRYCGSVPGRCVAGGRAFDSAFSPQ